MRASPWRLALFALAVFFATACEASADILIDVEPDGSGVVSIDVELDEEAADQLLDLESGDGLRLLDINEAGWVIDPPEVGDDGRTRFGATKPFGTPEQMEQVLAEISGDAGLLQNFELTRTKSFARVDYELTGQIVPNGIEPFGDEALTTSLGRTVESFVLDGGGSPADVDVTVRVRLPGNENTDDETIEVTGSLLPSDEADIVERGWRVTLDETSVEEVAIATATTNTAPLVWRGVAVVASVLALLVLFGHLLRWLRPERRKKRKHNDPRAKPRPSAKGPAKDEPVSGVPVGETDDEELDVAPVSDEPTVIALDAMGVLYREGQDIAEVLIPFARERGSEVTNDEIVSRARSLSLGRITPAEFWRLIEVSGDPNELDDEYLSRIQLSPGVVGFLRDLRERGVRVACLTNDSAVWANKLRAKHSLDGLIDPWVVSGSVGVRKPDWPIYEVLRRLVREPVGNVMVVDDDLDNLDAARELGYRTAWFAPDGDPAGARDHSILRSFNLKPAEPTPEPA